MDFRHEWKHEISYLDMLVLRQRLRAVAKADRHTIDGKYVIRSLYFDTPSDKALREKLDGISRREKFRLRLYNGDTGLIHLEKKAKAGGLGNKQVATLSKKETAAILLGDIEWMLNSERPLLKELYSKMRTQRLSPKTIVEYTREPYVYPAGNVRVTIDYDIRTGLGGTSRTDFLSPGIRIPAGEAPIILEVKWDAFLPAIIRDAVQLQGRHTSAFSKYAQCRIYG